MSRLGHVAAVRMDHIFTSLINLAEDNLLGEISDSDRAAKVDELLPDDMNTTIAPGCGLPTPGTPVHLEVIKTVKTWARQDLISADKRKRLIRYVVACSRKPNLEPVPMLVPLSEMMATTDVGAPQAATPKPLVTEAFAPESTMPEAAAPEAATLQGFTITLDDNMDRTPVEWLIAATCTKAGLSSASHYVTYNGRRLDAGTLACFGITEGATLQVVPRLKGGGCGLSKADEGVQPRNAEAAGHSNVQLDMGSESAVRTPTPIDPHTPIEDMITLYYLITTSSGTKAGTCTC